VDKSSFSLFGFLDAVPFGSVPETQYFSLSMLINLGSLVVDVV
jgi:hypothetical protein